jgi:hypothetical protein
MVNSSKTWDLVVVGAGSGGIGAALAGARLGLKVLLIEKENMVGGASTSGGVCCWEPSVGGTGIPFDIYRRLSDIQDAVGIYSFGRHFSWESPNYWPDNPEKVGFPGGEQVIDSSRNYSDTLRRHITGGLMPDKSFKQERWHGVVFEPEIMAQTVTKMVEDTGNCTIFLNTFFFGSEAFKWTSA